MTYVTTYFAAAGTAFMLIFCMPVQVSALEPGVYLDASASASSVEDLDMSLELKADASSSESSKAETADEENDSYGQTHESSWSKVWTRFTAGEHAIATTSIYTSFWEGFTNLLSTHVLLGATGTVSEESTTTLPTLAGVHVEAITKTHATVSWSPSVFQSVSVYYATTTPVVVASTTAHETPWKFWKRSQVTLKGLTSDTVYFYKVVATTMSGTTTMVEASFRTTAN